MLGERIATLRRQAGLSQKELAVRLHVSPSTIGMYEQDRREPSIEKLLELAKIFNVTVGHLLTGKPDDPADAGEFAAWFRRFTEEFADAELMDASGALRPFSVKEAAMLAAALPDSDESMMREALNLAAEAALEGEVPVGCVVVKDGVIIGRGRNRREKDKHALAHAELEAILQACKTLGGWRLFQCTLYVTLEPCPMCAGAIINARIPRVVYGAKDPKAGSCGSVCDLFSMPYNHHPKAEQGLLEQACSQILRQFFSSLRQKKGKPIILD